MRLDARLRRFFFFLPAGFPLAARSRFFGLIRRLRQDLRARRRTETDLRRAIDTLLRTERELREENRTRKAVETELRESRERLRLALDAASMGEWSWDLLRSELSVSSQASRIFGLPVPPEKARVEDFLAYIHPDDRGLVLDQAVRGGREGGFHLRYRILRGGSELRHVEAWGRVLRRENGEPWLIIGVTRDITALIAEEEGRKKAEGEVRELNTRLEERVRQRTLELENANRELEAFSFSVSHDLRAPLRAVEGFTRYLAQSLSGRLEEESALYLSRVLDNVRRMQALIDDLLGLSRLTRLEMRFAEVSLSALAEEVTAGLREKEEGGEGAALREAPRRNVSVYIEPGLTALGDRNLLRIMLANLFGNAWKFTRDREEARIEFRREGKGFSLRDNGAGFDPAYAGKLFQPFQRLHPESEFEGTGIGLAMVLRVVRRHGGWIEAEGRPGEGAVFRFGFPEKGSSSPGGIPLSDD